MKDYIGRLVKRFESGDKGSLITGQSGFDGGGSYGTYQFTLRYGVVIDFLKKFFTEEAKELYYNGPDVASSSWSGKDYSSSPDEVTKVWMTCYNKVGAAKFFEYEHQQIENICYKPCKDRIIIQTGIDIDKISRAYQELVWSGSVHFGATTFGDMLVKAIRQVGDFARYQDKVFDLIYQMRYEKMKEAYPNPGNRYLPGFFDGSSEVETLRPYLTEEPLEEEIVMEIKEFKADSRVYRDRNIDGKVGSLKDVKAIVHHYTGVCGQTARGNAEYFGTLASHADDPLLSIHFIVDDTEVWSCVPMDKRAGHCDDAGIGQFKGVYMNENTIGIEVCPHHTSGKTYPDAYEKGWYFSDSSIELLKQLDVYIVKEIIKAGGNIPALVRHYDITSKWCPAPFLDYGGNDWEAFKADVMSRINDSNSVEKPTNPTDNKVTMTGFWYCDGTVTINCSVNAYSNAKLSSKISGVLAEGAKYRAVQGIQMSDGTDWYRLETGVYVQNCPNISYADNNMKRFVVAVNSPDGVLNLRDFPNSNIGNAKKTLKNGDLMEVYGEAYNNGEHWYLVDQGNAPAKFSGFVAARYVE